MASNRMCGLLMVSLDAVQELKYLMFGGKPGKGRSVVSKLTMNNCRCNGTDMCGGGADPMMDVYILNDAGQKIIGFQSNRLHDNAKKKGVEYIYQTVSMVVDTDLSVEGKDKNIMRMVIKDHDKGAIENDEIGYVDISLALIFREGNIDSKLFTLLKDPNNPSKSPGKIIVSCRYYDFLKAQKEGDGFTVPLNHFPTTENNKVQLYHDASRMPVKLGWDDDNHHFHDASTWTDLYRDLDQAQNFIIIMGWSVNLGIPLNRSWDPNDHEDSETLGELLARKQAEPNCEVFVVVWDDPSSLTAEGMFGGMMGTSDEATRIFCEEHNINFDKHKRISYYEGYSVIQGIADMHFTHHQKMVAFDYESIKPATGKVYPKRGVKAYWGGLDLTNGRFDTPEHHLFKYNDTVFHPKAKIKGFNDFHNACVKRGDCIANGGPRQPWHDIHASVVGPAAWDFVINFVERTYQQSNRAAVLEDPSSGHKMTLYKKFKSLLDRIHPEVLSRNYRNLQGEKNLFNCQMFRSICFKSCHFSKEPKDRFGPFASEWGHKFNRMVDHSIQNAYIYHITRAKRYIYFENQYWVGSAYAWKEAQSCTSHHRVPDTVVRTICNHIDHGRSFHVYINIPLFPEGFPNTAAVQEILHLQYQTIRMMACHVASHLKTKGRPTTDWRQYLSVYFMGKREPPATTDSDSDSTTDSPKDNSLTPARTSRMSLNSNRSGRSTKAADLTLKRVTRSRRHPIYIHSKFFVVDDEYALIGSANVNERSMCGIRDTEIAQGIWQPEHITRGEGHAVELPRGYVHEMRKHLWHELMGKYDNCMDDLGSPEAIAIVEQRAKANREAYWDDKRIDYLPHGFMCEYPYQWNAESEDLQGYADGLFPDFDALVTGNCSWIAATTYVTG